MIFERLELCEYRSIDYNKEHRYNHDSYIIIDKFLFKKTLTDDELVEKISKYLEIYTQTKIKDSKCEEVKLKLKESIDHMATKKLSEKGDNRKITRTEFIKLVGDTVDIKTNGKTLLSGWADFIRNMSDVSQIIIIGLAFIGISTIFRSKTKDNKPVQEKLDDTDIKSNIT